MMRRCLQLSPSSHLATAMSLRRWRGHMPRGLLVLALATCLAIPIWAEDDFVRKGAAAERPGEVEEVAAHVQGEDTKQPMEGHQKAAQAGLSQEHHNAAVNLNGLAPVLKEVPVVSGLGRAVPLDQQPLQQKPVQQNQDELLHNQQQPFAVSGVNQPNLVHGRQDHQEHVNEGPGQANLKPSADLNQIGNNRNSFNSNKQILLSNNISNQPTDNRNIVMLDNRLNSNVKQELSGQSQGLLAADRGNNQNWVGLRPQTGDNKPQAELRSQTGENKPQGELKPQAGENKPQGELRPQAGENKPQGELRPQTGENRPQVDNKDVNDNVGSKAETPVAVVINRDNSSSYQDQNRGVNKGNILVNNNNPVLGGSVSHSTTSSDKTVGGGQNDNNSNDLNNGVQNGQNAKLNPQNAFNNDNKQVFNNAANNSQHQQPDQQQQTQHQQPDLQQQQQQQTQHQQPDQQQQQQTQHQQPDQQQQTQHQQPDQQQQQQTQHQQPDQQQQQQIQQQQQTQTQQPQPQQPQIGGLNINWDFEDFSILFDTYGAAEMKVRRSPHPTTGEPWPLPQYYSKKDDKIFRVSKDLSFIPIGVKCDVLEEGLVRHLQRVLRGSVEDMYDNLQNAEGSPIEDPALKYAKEEFLKAPVITRVEVKVRKPCTKYPSLESDESYDLVVKKRKTYIWANEVWGALRGLETFGHIVWRGTDEFLYVKETVISDYPRFPHRGLLVDTSRHFLFKEVILDILESMEMNKLNVFHWHIVDDQSFPYESKVYPELSRKGSFHPTYVYSLEDIADIIEYARLRGIRVMPEFDTPGHTFAWGFSRPELLTQCYSGNTAVKSYFGPIDPSKNSTYRFLQTLFQEIVEVFKDQYLHLGGDEVPLACWQSNPEVMAFARELAKMPRSSQQQSQLNPGGWNTWSDDIRRVYEYYENRLINIINDISQKKKKRVKYVMWQEVMNNNLQLPNDTIIQVWMGDMSDVMRATSMGYQVLYSTCWYMDHIEYGTKWIKYYTCDPVDQSFGYHIDERKVLGGEAAFWSEYFSNENIIPLMWPRASAAAERLWSSKEVRNIEKAGERLSEHRCRMIKRGIDVGEISGPGYCLHSPPKRRLFNDTIGCRGGNCSHTRSLIQENFEVFVSQRGSSLADCSSVFMRGNANVFIMLTLALVVVIVLYILSKSSNRFHRIRICKKYSLLVVFVVVLLVYFLCYTTIWMRAFEFSGSFHKTLKEEDNTSETHGKKIEDTADVKQASS